MSTQGKKQKLQRPIERMSGHGAGPMKEVQERLNRQSLSLCRKRIEGVYSANRSNKRQAWFNNYIFAGPVSQTRFVSSGATANGYNATLPKQHLVTTSIAWHFVVYYTSSHPELAVNSPFGSLLFMLLSFKQLPISLFHMIAGTDRSEVFTQRDINRRIGAIQPLLAKPRKHGIRQLSSRTDLTADMPFL